MKLSLLAAADVQSAFAQFLREQRKKSKLSRSALAERSTVPAATIKKFELTGQISFRQLLLLWQSVDDLGRLHQLTTKLDEQLEAPTSIEEVLNVKL